MGIIKGKNIHMQYPGSRKPILKNVHFTIEEKRCTLFIGKSGSGKTSLLKCLSHLFSSYEGSIEYFGKPIREMSNSERVGALGFVSQQFNLFPHMTVLENCLHPQVHVLKRETGEAKEDILQIMEKLEIASLCDRFPHEISGGQQQRVAIARALGMRPKILLLDEPSSALDPESTAQLQKLLHNLKEQGITLVLSTHDMHFAKKLLDRTYFMENGRIVESFDKETEEIPKDSMTYQFIHNS